MTTAGLPQLADSLSAELTERLKRVIVDARHARDQCPSGTIDDGPPVLHEHLLRTRAMIERLESLTAEVGRIRSRTYSALEDARAEYEDAYMNAATSKSVGFSDYSSAKEKDAHFDLKALTEKMKMRKSKRLHDDVDSVWQFCRTLLRGAEGVHRDLEVRIRLITMTTALDR